MNEETDSSPKNQRNKSYDATESNKRRRLEQQTDTQSQQPDQQQQSNSLDLFNIPLSFVNDGNNNNSHLFNHLNLDTAGVLPDDLFTFVTNNDNDRRSSIQAGAIAVNNITENTPEIFNNNNNLITSSPRSITSPISTASKPADREQIVNRPMLSPQLRMQQQQTNKTTYTSHDSDNDIRSMVQEDFDRRAPLDPPDQSVHTIVVGGRAFRLSWESLKSDASPTNFFIEYFRKIASSSTSTANQQQRSNSNKKRIMHIDRDPDLFEQVVRHLRGYYIRPKDDVEYQALLCDSLYYGLAHLRKSLLEYLFVNVGGRLFRVSWDLFSRDGRHNFFTGPLRHSLHTPPKGERNVSPLYIDRDPDIFQNIIHHLRGYTIHIRDEEHRKNLLRDAQYYVFRQLYDKLLTVMPGTALPGYSDSGLSAETCNCGIYGSTPEILMKLSDIRPSNLIKPDPQKLEESADLQYHRNVEGETSHRLLIQLTGVEIQIHHRSDENDFHYKLIVSNEADKKKLRAIADTFKTDLGKEIELRVLPECVFRIDGVDQAVSVFSSNILAKRTLWLQCNEESGKEHTCEFTELTIQRAIFRLDTRLKFFPLVLEGFTGRYHLNARRQFLT